MKLGFIGLGRMGGNMVERLMLDSHEVVVYNKTQPEILKVAEKGAIASSSAKDLVGKLGEKDNNRKIVWLMVPSGAPVDENIEILAAGMKADDIIIDGGNSFYKDSQSRAKKLAESGIHTLDCGTSGGVWGLKEGYSLMTGGNKDATEYVYHIYNSLAPECGYTYCA